MNTNYVFENGQEVTYDNGVFSGEALVVGVATTPLPVIGHMYILLEMSGNIPNAEYPYNHFTCAECHLKAV
jgi:hypothetical protein